MTCLMRQNIIVYVVVEKRWYMGNGGTWETAVHGKRRYMGNAGTWETPVHGKRRYMGNAGTWEMPVQGNAGTYLYITSDRKLRSKLSKYNNVLRKNQ